MGPRRFSVCAPVGAQARLSGRPLHFSAGRPALFNSPVRLGPPGCAQLSEFPRMFTAGEAHADPAIAPDSGTTARRTTLWVPNPQRGDPSWLFRPKNCNPSPASWPPADEECPDRVFRCRRCGCSAQTELDGCPACRADWKAIDVRHGPSCPKNLL